MRDQQQARAPPLAPRLRSAATPSGNNATQQFLELDGRVLRFWAAWVPGSADAASPSAAQRVHATATTALTAASPVTHGFKWQQRQPPPPASPDASSQPGSGCARPASLRASNPEQPLPFVVHYYLADDTIEVAEATPPNSGRDPFPLLLRRSRLPRQLPTVGACTGRLAWCVARGGLASVLACWCAAILMWAGSPLLTQMWCSCRGAPSQSKLPGRP